MSESEWDKSSSERQIVKRMDSVRDCTVRELVDWCIHRGLDLDTTAITAAHVKWQSLETVDERDRRLEFNKYHEERLLKWERETWERLNEKYGKQMKKKRGSS